MDEPQDRSLPMEPPGNLQPDGRYRPGDPLWPEWNSYGWSYRDQDRFEARWTPEGNKVADDLADRYAHGWPYLIARALAARTPDLAAALMDFATGPEAPDIPPGEHPDSMYEHIAMWGSYFAVRKKRTWDEPKNVICPTCGQKFWNQLDHWQYRKYGPARFCGECCWVALAGYQGPGITEKSAIAAVRKLSDALGMAPPQDYFMLPFPPDANDADRDKWMGALISTPPPDRIKQTLGCKDWLGVLQIAGLADDSWRPDKLETMCRAKDGHLCRSLLEKSVDDWLTWHGIHHEREPYWPFHATLNPSGLRRADWLMPDGCYVECLGLDDQEWYSVKTAQKRELARDLGIKLHLVYPDEILRLEKIFTNYLDG